MNELELGTYTVSVTKELEVTVTEFAEATHVELVARCSQHGLVVNVEVVKQ